MNSSIKPLSPSQTMGSIFYLENPGNITIVNSFFYNNTGIFGSAIYYSELRNNLNILTLTKNLQGDGYFNNISNNIFEQNLASFGGGVVHFQNNFPFENPLYTNKFSKNYVSIKIKIDRKSLSQTFKN